MENNKNIAVTIQNTVQYYSIAPGIDKLINMGYKVDIYIPIYSNDVMGFKDMYQNIYNKLVNLKKYNIYRQYTGKKYKVVLTPYDMGIFFKFNTKYNLKYKYAVSAKPKLTLTADENIIYDGILCYSTWETDMLKVYSPTYNVGNIKFTDFKKKRSNKNNKPILLYLPTYGKYSSINEVYESLENLKKDYKIITKLHHGTTHLKDEKDKVTTLSNICDEIYDENQELVKLLEIADVVISDNSGAIFESIYAKVPVAIFSKKEDLNLGDLTPLQDTLIKEKIIPYTNNPKYISSIVKQALSKETRNKQLKVSKKLFTVKNEDLVKKFVEVIEFYINDNVNNDYYYLHKELVTTYENLKNNNLQLSNSNNELLNNKICLENKIQDLNNILIEKENYMNLLQNELNDYRNGKLYKISSKIYRILSKIRRK